MSKVQFWEFLAPIKHIELKLVGVIWGDFYVPFKIQSINNKLISHKKWIINLKSYEKEKGQNKKKIDSVKKQYQ